MGSRGKGEHQQRSCDEQDQREENTDQNDNVRHHSVHDQNVKVAGDVLLNGINVYRK